MSVALQRIRDALEAYADGCACPGIVIEPGATSGCNAALTGATDCPTCSLLAALPESGIVLSAEEVARLTDLVEREHASASGNRLVDMEKALAILRSSQ